MALATCADCGDRIPFDLLTEHVCFLQSRSTSQAESHGLKSQAEAVPHLDTATPYPVASHAAGASALPSPSHNQHLSLSPSPPASPSSLPSPSCEEIVTLRRKRIAEQRAAATAQKHSHAHSQSSTTSGRSKDWCPHHSEGSEDEQICDEDGIVFGLQALLLAPPNDEHHGNGTALLHDCTTNDSLTHQTHTGNSPCATPVSPASHPSPPLHPSETALAQGDRSALPAPHTTSKKNCSQCLRPLGTLFISQSRERWCKECYASHFCPRCPTCYSPVEGRGVKSKDPSLGGAVYHVSCFVCSHAGCQASLVHERRVGSGDHQHHMVFQGRPFCSKHYHQVAGTLCLACGTGVEGMARYIPVGEKGTEHGRWAGVYHPSCLMCQFTPTMLLPQGHQDAEKVQRQSNRCLAVRITVTVITCLLW